MLDEEVCQSYGFAKVDIAVPIQMRYKIISPGAGACLRQAPTDVPYINENRYILIPLFYRTE
ncbi:hypothetical protein [Nostoc sp.]|uniref:hypothetical protein n=1 Tax=Nostoc sp. TaxID=1180 RepID=UPI002FF7A9F8